MGLKSPHINPYGFQLAILLLLVGSCCAQTAPTLSDSLGRKTSGKNGVIVSAAKDSSIRLINLDALKAGSDTVSLLQKMTNSLSKPGPNYSQVKFRPSDFLDK